MVSRKLLMLENQMKKSCVKQPEEEMPLCPDTWLPSSLGMVVEVKQMSTKARLARKKDMGLWSL